MIIMKQIIASALCFITFTAFAQKNQLRLKKGDVIFSLVESSQDIDMGMGMQMNTNLSGAYELSVYRDHHDSAYTILAKMVSTKVVATGAGQDQTYNSETGEGADSELGSMLKDNIGRQDTLIVNRYTGVVTKKDTVTINLLESLNKSEEDLATVSENSLFIIRDDAKQGDKWTVKSKTGGVDSETDYELKSIDGKVATIEYKTKVNGSSEVEVQGMPMMVTTNGKVEGDFTTDIETGLIFTKSIVSDLKSSMEIMGQTMEMSAKGKVTVTNRLK